MGERRWRVRLGAAAEVDFANILKWTTENFGARQSRIYRNTLVQAIGELAEGPDVVGSRVRDEIVLGLRTLHVARHGRRGSHFLMYRIAPGGTIEIVRILRHRIGRARLSFHTSFENPLTPGAPPRESIEVRTLVFFPPTS
jgi:toxin ParE1/3/4